MGSDMDIQQALARVVEGENLSGEEMTSVMRAVMTGEAEAIASSQGF